MAGLGCLMSERSSRFPVVRRAAKQDLLGLRRLDSSALFLDAQEIVIVHSGQEYRLRITRYDKLILTK